MTSLRSRQIHLDFHTHGAIPGIGSAFDAAEFARTLEQAHVNSVTCFARCHHGWMYYDTAAFPERRHPNLQRNLLPEQIEACHARGIRVPVYVTVQWDAFTAAAHPEWRVLNADGSLEGTPPYEAGFYRSLCVNTPYRDFLREQVKEIVSLMPTDGFFFDIVSPRDCSCTACVAEMLATRLDPARAEDRVRFGLQVLNRFKEQMSELVHALRPEATVFFNAGHVGTRHRAIAHAYTHFELESLPSGGWGYLHFPVAVRYARTLGKACLGHTGKFHTSWGDFHSYKNEAALQYECFRMLAHGAACLVGDQMHPDGRLDPEAYRLIGRVYEQVQQKEPWCTEVRPLVDIGVLAPEEGEESGTGRLPLAIKGVTEMLEELGQQFDIIDGLADLSAYKVVVMPDRVRVGEGLSRALSQYLARGGSLLASFGSGLDPAMGAPVTDALGIQAVDAAAGRDGNGVDIRGRPFEHNDFAEFLHPGPALRNGLADTEYVMYMKGTSIAARPGSEVLAEKRAPFFDRDWRHFSSHRQAPSNHRPAGPAVIRLGRSIYFTHPVFEQYMLNAPRWCKQLVANALGLLLPRPLAAHDGPSTLRVTVNAQEASRRWVVHLLHYIPERRSETIDVVEDIIPVRDVAVRLRTTQPVTAVRLVPSRDVLTFARAADESVTFTVPVVNGHQMVEIAFA